MVCAVRPQKISWLHCIMDSDDGTQSKLVRYSGSSEKESFQWDDQDMPLYSPGNIKSLRTETSISVWLTIMLRH